MVEDDRQKKHSTNTRPNAPSSAALFALAESLKRARDERGIEHHDSQ